MNEIMQYLGEAYGSVPGLVAFTILVAEMVGRWTNLDGFKAQLQAWAVSVVLCGIGAVLNVGIFAEEGVVTQWYYEMLVAGFFIGLAANGLFQVPGVTSILEKLKIRKPSDQPPPSNP